MQFRTSLPLQVLDFQLSHDTPVLSLGSCFAASIGKRIQQAKIPTLVNPFGVLFHPLAIAKVLHMGLTGTLETTLHHAPHLGRYHSFDFPTLFQATERSTLERQLQEVVQESHAFLQETQHLILTLGTAWAYRRKEDGQLVANNHKYPGQEFEKELSSPGSLIEAYTALFSQLPNKQILLTVSPVRHLRDTLPLNSVSKSVLRLVCHELSQRFPQVHYFPAFELLLDDLRDYRFYANDLLHPNEQGEQYIWEYFCQACFPPQTQQLVQQWSRIQQSLSHRPRHPQSAAHQQFLKQLLTQLAALPPELNCEEEKEALRSKLASQENL